MTTNSTSDPKAILEAANSTSDKVAVLHITFLAICTYVLVIVFSTTDVDLLIGKGVRLPLVNVDVPILGFYVTVPYLLVLFHFNLLLQLQLLSRQLFAFDHTAPEYNCVGGLHDQLNVFPYNYYLVGRVSRLVRGFAALLVIVTILVLPLLALLTLQARFLAYQSQPMTWTQRVATWLDVAMVLTLWPVIMDPNDSWCDYIRGVWQRVRSHWLRWIWGLFGLVIVGAILVSQSPESFVRRSMVISAWAAVGLLAP